MIAEDNQLEMESVFKLAHDRGFLPNMVSLTVRHNASMLLRDFLGKLQKAITAIAASRPFKRLRVEGLGADAYAWVIEIAHGFRNGQHAHCRGIFFLRSKECLPLLEALRLERT